MLSHDVGITGIEGRRTLIVRQGLSVLLTIKMSETELGKGLGVERVDLNSAKRKADRCFE